MRHKMLVPLQLLVRVSDPLGTPAAGDLYFNSDEKLVKVFNGEQWSTITGSSNSQVNAGAGLTGGGEISGDVTLNVGAGTGINVADDIVSVDALTVQMRSEKGVAGGYAPLDADLKVPIGNLPTGTTSSHVASGNHNHGNTYLEPGDIKAGANITVTPNTSAGEVTIAATGVLTQGVADGLYVNVAGDTMSGDLTISRGAGQDKPKVTFAQGTGSAFFELNGTVVALRKGATPTELERLLVGTVSATEESDMYAAANRKYVDSRIWVGTQADYNGINPKDPSVLYCIKE